MSCNTKKHIVCACNNGSKSFYKPKIGSFSLVHDHPLQISEINRIKINNTRAVLITLYEIRSVYVYLNAKLIKQSGKTEIK